MGGRQSRSKLPEGCLLDDCDIGLLEGRTWKVRSPGYVMAKSLGKSYLLHRLVLNALPGEIVDHINRDKLDNRKCNLRLCTPGQNAVNTPKQPGKHTSKYKGVYFYKRLGKWLARLSIKRKLVWSGYFTSEIEAAKAYDKALVHYFGEYALTNFKGEET